MEIIGNLMAITLGVTNMNTYRITLEVDEKWLEAINNLTNDVYEGETDRSTRLNSSH